MAVREKAWQIFAEELKLWMDEKTPMSSSELARKLETLGLDDINVERINNWRKGTAPRLAELPYIVEALEMGRSDDDKDGAYRPNYLAERMGIIRPEVRSAYVVDMAYRLQKTELKYYDALSRAAAMGQTIGAAGIINAAVAEQKWAVGVWPATEGPADCRLHVSDRIDIRSSDPALQEKLEYSDVWADENMKRALRAAYALPATRGPRWAYKEPGVTNWSISHVGSPMAPTITRTHPGFESVGFDALTVDSWVNDVASLVATVIGYGLSTTRDLAMEVHGIPGGQTKAEDREEAHQWFLRHPPKRRVWSHHAPLRQRSEHHFLGSGTPSDRRTVHIWLQEDAKLLEDWLNFAPRQPEITLDSMLADQELIAKEIDELKSRSSEAKILTLPVRHCGKGNVEARWRQVLENVRDIVNQLDDMNYLTTDLVPAQRQMMTQRPNIAGPLFRWLSRNGCTAVRKVPDL